MWSRSLSLYRGRHDPEVVHVLAGALWRTLLLTTLLGIAGVLAYGAWELVVVLENLTASGGSRSNPPALLDRAKLEQTLRAFESRNAQYEAARTSRPSVTDPSR